MVGLPVFRLSPVYAHQAAAETASTPPLVWWLDRAIGTLRRLVQHLRAPVHAPGLSDPSRRVRAPDRGADGRRRRAAGGEHRGAGALPAPAAALAAARGLPIGPPRPAAGWPGH